MSWPNGIAINNIRAFLHYYTYTQICLHHNHNEWTLTIKMY